MRDNIDKTMDRIAGHTINEHREAKGLSLRGLGDKVGITGQILHKYENGEHSMRISTFVKLAEALDVKPSHLFDLVLVRFRNQSKKRKGK